jgi:UDPglucose 6-dehydrogenase
VNDERKAALAERVAAACGGSVRGRCIAMLGLSFKPNTDDLREAPALPLVAALQAAGATVRAYDPAAMELARPLLPGVTFAADAYDCATGADALVIVTEWEVFRALDTGRLRQQMRAPVLVDFRNIYRPDEMREAGFVYHGIGRAAGHGSDPESEAIAAQ